MQTSTEKLKPDPRGLATHNLALAPSTKNSKTNPDPKNSQIPGRDLGKTLAGTGSKVVEVGAKVAGTAAEIGKDLALGAAKLGADSVVNKGKEELERYILNNLKMIVANTCGLPFIGSYVSKMVAAAIFPSYQKLNPQTQHTAESLTHLLNNVKIEEISDELVPVFTAHLSQNLSPEDQVKLQEGNSLVLLKAFGKTAWAKTFEIANSFRSLEGIKNLCSGVADYIPLINQLPATLKMIAGGGIGLMLGSFVFRFALRLIAIPFNILSIIPGLGWIRNFTGAGVGDGVPPQLAEMMQGQGGAKGFMENLSKMAQAAQANGRG